MTTASTAHRIPPSPTAGARPAAPPDARPDARPAPGAPRLVAIDAMRGCAMLFVCFAHFRDTAALGAGVGVRRAIGMLASPAFMIVSGLLLGYMYASGSHAYARFVDKIRERAVLLLTVVHAALIPSHVLVAGGLRGALHTLFITDTIAIALLIGPFVVPRVGRGARVALAAALVAGSWAVLYSTPEQLPFGLALMRETLVGSPGVWVLDYNFPVLPWFGLYLVGTVIGEDLGRSTVAEVGGAARRTMETVLLRWGAVLLTAAFAVLVCGALVQVANPSLDAGPTHMLFSPFSKRPPSPPYFLMYAGLALVLAARIARAIETGRARWAVARLVDIGRASVWVFVLQYFLYYVVAVLWPMRAPRLWPLYFAASLVAVALSARVWLAMGGNRLLQVPGWRRLGWASR